MFFEFVFDTPLTALQELVFEASSSREMPRMRFSGSLSSSKLVSNGALWASTSQCTFFRGTRTCARLGGSQAKSRAPAQRKDNKNSRAF